LIEKVLSAVDCVWIGSIPVQTLEHVDLDVPSEDFPGDEYQQELYLEQLVTQMVGTIWRDTSGGH
jgi:hypothetical protein